MQAQAFVDELARRLRDVGKRQWQQETLVAALNAALRSLCTVIPRAYTVHRTIELVAGTEQTLPADLHKIVQLLHNVCPESGEPRRAITLADKAVLDAAYPHWRQDASRAYIRHYMSDAMNDQTFYVWPPAREAAEAVAPVAGDTVPVGETGLALVRLYNSNPGGAPVGWTYFAGPTGVPRLVAGDEYYVQLADDHEALSSAEAFRFTPIGFDHIGNSSPNSFKVFLVEQGVQILDTDPRMVDGAYVRVRMGQSDVIHEGQPVAGDAQVVAFGLPSTPGVPGVPAIVTQQVRGQFTAVPSLSDAEPPVLPEVPVDPGALGDGAEVAPLGLFVAQRSNLSSSDGWLPTTSSERLAEINAQENTSDNTSFSFRNDDIIDLQLVAPASGWRNFNYLNFPARVNGFSIITGAAAGFTMSEIRESGSPVLYSDSRMVEGEVLRLQYDVSNSLWNLIGVNLNTSGTTQQDIDAYQAALADYNAAVAARDAFLANNTTLTDPIPVHDIYIEPVFQYALYYCYAVDDDVTANTARANRHWLAFFQLLNKQEDASLLVANNAEGVE